MTSLLGCCIGYVVVQRPAEYYDNQNQPYAYQWQILEHRPSEYQSNYYNSAPALDFPKYSAYNFNSGLYFDESQKLLQVYRLIRVIVIFREPVKTKTSLDKLVQQLTNETLQEQLVELLYQVDGFDEVAALERGPPGIELDPFVDNNGRLLLAIQRALNALDLDDDNDDYYGKRVTQGCSTLPEKLRKQLKVFRDVANALTVAQIETKDTGTVVEKENVAKDLLENLNGEEEDSSLVDDVNKDFDVDKDDKVAKESLALGNVEEYGIDNVEVEQQSNTPEVTFWEKEKIRKRPVLLEPIVDTTTSTTSTTTTSPIPTPMSENDRNSWLAQLFSQGNLQPIDVSQPAELFEPEVVEANTWVPGNTKTLDFDIDQRLQALADTEKPKTVSAVTHSVPLWLTNRTENPKDEYKKSGYEILNKTEYLLREVPDNDVTTEEAAKLEIRGLPDEQTTVIEEQEATTEITGEVEARELPDDHDQLTLVEEEKTESAIEGEGLEFIFDPEIPPLAEEKAETTEPAIEGESQELPLDHEQAAHVEEQVDELDKFDLLADLTEHKMKNSTPEPFTVDEQLEHQEIDEQSPTETGTEETVLDSAPLQSREEPSSLSSTVAAKSDAHQFVKEEILKVLRLLEEATGFTELNNTISNGDVDQLVDGMSVGKDGTSWTEMINALQKLVTEKQLENGREIIEVLEQWKEADEVQLDNGYFGRTYGGGDVVENREDTTVDDGIAENRNPRIVNTDEQQEIDQTTGNPINQATGSESSKQEDATEELNENTSQSFPTDETESLALD